MDTSSPLIIQKSHSGESQAGKERNAGVKFSKDGEDDKDEGGNNDKKLSNRLLKKFEKYLSSIGETIHKIKDKKSGSKTDLFYDPKTGDIKIKPKDGKGPGEPTGFNINQF